MIDTPKGKLPVRFTWDAFNKILEITGFESYYDILTRVEGLTSFYKGWTPQFAEAVVYCGFLYGASDGYKITGIEEAREWLRVQPGLLLDVSKKLVADSMNIFAKPANASNKKK